MRKVKAALLAAVTLPAFAVAAQAAPATWSATPANNNFNNSVNWSAGGPPGSGEQGTFGASSITVVQFQNAATTTGGFTFNSGSPAYTVLVTNGRTLTVNGVGNTRLTSPLITEQTITFSVDSLGDLRFIGSNASNGPGSIVYANAGNLLINGGSAGNATIQNGVTGTLSFANSNGGTANIVNSNLFQLNATSDLQNAVVVNNLNLRFLDNASAGSANIVNNFSLLFQNNATAGASTMTTANGASTQFFDATSGGTSRQILNAGGLLSISTLASAGTTFGSVEGAGGSFDLGAKNATVGGNNHNFVAPNAAGERVVTYAGQINGAGGSITKVGTGTWVLSGVNNYTGATNFNGGIVQVNADNNLGNGGPLNFNGGTLRFTGPGAAPVITRVVTLNPGGGTIDVDPFREVEFATNIGEAGGAQSLRKTGFGGLTMTGNSTYTGATIIETGTFTLGTNGAGGNVAGPVQINGGSDSEFRIRRSDNFTFGQNISGTGGILQFGDGTTTLTGNNTYSGGTRILSGGLIASGGNAIGDESTVEVVAPATLELANSETVGRLAGNGNVRLNANVLTLGFNINGGAGYSGVLSGTGSVVKNGTSFQSFEGVNTYTGGTTINGGELQINGVVLNDVVVNAGSTLSGNGLISGNVISDSGNLSPGNSPGILTIGADYLAGGSPTLTVDIETNNVGAGGTPGVTHDLLNVGGTYISNPTQVLLVPTGEPVAITGNGAEFARFGGATAPGNFFLSTAVQSPTNGFVGGFQYLVNYVPTAGADSFFLRNVVREELVAHATALAAGRQVGRDCFRGPEHTQNSDGKGQGRAWVNGRYGSFESDASTGADFDSDYFCVNGGVDLPLADGFVAGLRGGYASQEVDLNVVQGVANLDGDTWNFEAALTYANASGYYSGLTLGYRSTDWTYDKALVSGGRTQADIDGVVGSLYAGYRYTVDANSTLSFEGAVLYDATDCDANCFIFGAQEDTSDWEGRIAARYDATWGSIKPYAIVSLTHNFDDGQKVWLGNAISQVDTASALLGLNLGLQADLGEGWALTAEVSTTQGLDSEVEGYQGVLGLKKSW